MTMQVATATGTRDEFQRLYEAELDYVWASLRRLGVPPASLEDICHDVFITAWKKLKDYDRSRPIRPWLFGIAYRVASDHRSRASVQREVLDEDADVADPKQSPHELAEHSQARKLIAKALEVIPIERRGVFVMHDIDGVAIPEVAETFGIPLNTAYSRLRLARRDFEGAVQKMKEAAHG
jgi:RNA polymerase sigma-70 factor (ECF subfamily)